MRQRSFILVIPLCLLLAGPAGAKRVLYSFLDNRPMAHLDRDGLYIEAGGAGFVKYIQGNHKSGWLLEQDVDGRNAAMASGLRAKIYLPLSKSQAKSTRTVEIGMKALRGAQAATVFFNDERLKNLQVDEGWQQVTLSIPKGLAKTGENTLRIHLAKSEKRKGKRYCAALSYIRLRPEEAVKTPEDRDLWGRVLVGPKDGASGEGLNLTGPGGVAYYLRIPKGAALEISPGLRKGAPGGCGLSVQALDDRGQETVLWKGQVEPGGGWQPIQIPLKKVQDRPVRLPFEASKECQGFAAVARAALVGPGQVKKVSRAKKPTNVVFWLVDTTRADEIECYGKTYIKTPNFTALSKEGVIFDHAYVQGNESKTSHASIFTGVYPLIHKVVSEKAKLPTKLTTLAEALKSGGLYTAGFISNGYISKSWNYHQGFQKYVNFVREKRPPNAKALWKETEKWLRKNHEKPFYLYLGTIDPHVTYRYLKGYTEMYADPKYSGPFKKGLSGEALGQIKAGKLKVSESQKKYIRALHDGSITYNDHYFGELMAALKELGHGEDTMVVVTADHGDEFWERGSVGHGHSMYEELVSVPLIISFPPLFPKGKRVHTGVDDLDIMPTILDAMGIPIPKEVQGESIIDLASQKDPIYPHTSINTFYNNAYAVRLENVKFHLYAGDKMKLYDIAKDPGEKKDLLGKRPVMERLGLDLISIFVAHQESWRKGRDGVPSNLTSRFSKRIGAR